MGRLRRRRRGDRTAGCSVGTPRGEVLPSKAVLGRRDVGASVLPSRRARRWGLALWLLWLAIPRPGLAAACEEAALMLVHPVVAPAYEAVIEALAEGLAQGVSQPIAVCPLAALSTRAWPRRPRQVVAVGASAYAAVAQTFPQARVLPVLVEALPPPAREGLSRFVDPVLVLGQLRALAPHTQTLYFIHRRTVPAGLIRRAQGAAEGLGLHWVPIAVGGLREAALAIERVRGEARTTSGVWLHRDVLTLNPDILIPPIVRRSWEVGFPVISDDAETVERGLLFALIPDYQAVGRALATRLSHPHTGLTDLQWTHRLLNRRTARAIGLTVPPGAEGGFDAVVE